MFVGLGFRGLGFKSGLGFRVLVIQPYGRSRIIRAGEPTEDPMTPNRNLRFLHEP